MSSSASDSGKSSRAPEFTWQSLSLGLVLSVVMGAAAVYLGLKAGMTVAASIPASVIALGVLRGLFKRQSLLECNIVQTTASAGESLAAGIIFTMPALLILGEWKVEDGVDYWTTTIIALSGGLLGVLLMVPMRRVFIVDNPELKYPEGIACAEVLRAGGGTGAASAAAARSGLRLVIAGLLVGALFKFVQKFFGLLDSTVHWAGYEFKRLWYFGSDISPALVSVGFIVGLSIAVQIFIGGAIGWFIAIPAMQEVVLPVEAEVTSGVVSGLFQGADPRETLSIAEAEAAAVPADAVADALWKDKVRYIGVGAMLVGGVISIWRVRRGLAAAMSEMTASLRGPRLDPGPPTERNLSGAALLTMGILCLLLVGALYLRLLHGSIGLTLVTVAAMLVMSFFFTAVASYIVGLVGNSNSPVSGMTITAVLATGGLIALFGFGGQAAMVATIGVAGVVCCVACTSGDVCNDLKTGYLVGASPRLQQIAEILGVVVAAFVMAPVMNVLHLGNLDTGGIGGSELAAPQAGLFAALAEGFFGDEPLPWGMVSIGLAIGVGLLLADLVLERLKLGFRLYVMPVAVGIYLPFEVAVPILIGGLLSYVVARWGGASKDARLKRGVLVCSGIIAGESLAGVGLGFLAYMEVADAGLDYTPSQSLSFAALLAVVAWMYRAMGRREPAE